MRVLVLGATGGVGSLVVEEAVARGHDVRAQSRDAGRLAGLPPGAEAAEADPTDPARMAVLAQGCHAAIFALGVDRLGPTTLFSDATRALIAAMCAAGARRLVAITGVGAGETRGHGGWLYDRVIFPLFTKARYADKDLQEALLRDSSLDWTILRPAPFARRAGEGPLETHEAIPPDLALTNVTRAEVARCAVDLLDRPETIGRTLFFGRR